MANDSMSEGGLNGVAWRLCEHLAARSSGLKIKQFSHLPLGEGGGGAWDFGLHTPGGLQAGLLLANVTLGGAGRARIEQPAGELGPWPIVTVSTDHPVLACLASQYAGWRMQWDGFFGMGSGPMRAAAGSEAIYDAIGHRESADRVVGVCETGHVPTEDVMQRIATATGVPLDRVLLLVAPTRSLAGTVQIVARSVETALHQMHARGWDLTRVVAGFGTAPLPPVASNDLTGIGRTNDAILYGARVTLWVMADDDEVRDIAVGIHSATSTDYGRPFVEVFARYNHDFYQVDPHLFAPAEVHLINLATGRTFSAGKLAPDILRQSFHS